ncbi:hypothetical protein N8933_09255 [Pseudomonadales bacterium]|nr:hypothetical protein [Pseudomonadales bacterium]
MPKRAAETPTIDSIAGHGVAFVVQTDKNDSEALRWYVRGKKLPNLSQPVKALNLDFKAHKNQEKEVLALAKPIVEDWKRRNDRNQPSRPKTLSKLWDDYYQESKKDLEANKKLIANGREPTWIVTGGAGLWTDKLLAQRKLHWNVYLKPFWFDKARYKSKLVIDITYDDIKAWQQWRQDLYPHQAPSTVNKQNTTLRHLFKLAIRQGENFAPLKIIEAQPKLTERRRGIISDKQMEKVEAYLEKQYRVPFAEGQKLRRHIYPYLLKNYLDLLKFSGIRPWTTRQNAVRMKDVDVIERAGKEITILITRREKAKAESSATVSRRFIKNYSSLNRFYESFGIGKDREFLFVHPISVGSVLRKGEPILSFKKQWQTMMRHFGWNETATEGQKDSLSFYSYRHAFITNKLINNKQINIFELAKSTRTSIKMIETIYAHYLNERRADAFLSDDYDYVDTCTIFTPEGLELKNVKTNSEEHWDWWKKSPELVAFPPLSSK